MNAVVHEGCIGCGLCTSTCPTVFHMVDGISQGGPVPDNQESAAREAAEGCPVAVIAIQE